MRVYEITYKLRGVPGQLDIEAPNRWEALSEAWEKVPEGIGFFVRNPDENNPADAGFRPD